MADNRGLVLVTGGSGYIASFTIAQLLKEGWSVRTSVRSLGREADVRQAIGQLVDPGAALEVVQAELSSDNGWAEAVQGCKYVLHIASPLPSSDTGDEQALIGPARDGTLRVLTAARDAGVERVVVTSSVGAIAYGHGSYETPLTETTWSNVDNRSDIAPYEVSKTLAEKAAWEWQVREGGSLELVTVCPGAVLGPVLGPDFSDSVDIVKKMLEGKVPGLPRFGWPLVDVRDIADLHVRAMTVSAAAGQRYIGAEAFFWLKEIAEVVREGVPAGIRRVPRMTLPNWLVKLAARNDPVVRGRFFDLGKKRPVSAAKAKRELGWNPRPSRTSIVETAKSLLDRGIVKT